MKTPLILVKKMGGPVSVARVLKLKSHTGVYSWKVIPAHHVLILEAQFGIPATPHEVAE